MDPRMGLDSFSELQDYWYDKLKDLGFKEIEQKKKPGGPDFLKIWHHSYFQKRYSPERFRSKEQYYRLASQFFNDYSFPTLIESQIWELHSEGVPMRLISERLTIKTCQVFQTIRELKQKMIKFFASQDP